MGQATQDHELPIESFACQLLARWGGVFRDHIVRETTASSWRDLLVTLRRMEARGEISGGRFINGFLGDQFASAEAVEALRLVRRTAPSDHVETPLMVSAADPLNLVGIVIAGQRISALSGEIVTVFGENGARLHGVPFSRHQEAK